MLQEKFLKILTEGYKFNSPEEAITAIKTKQVGARVAPFLLNAQIDDKIKEFYQRAKELGVNDPTYGVQFLVSHVNNLNELELAIKTDSIYAYLKNYKKPWVKELPSFNDFNSKPFNSQIWHSMEREINSGLSQHGKTTKGSGDIKNVKILYPKDSDGWELMIPLNFDGAKAASFFGKENEKPIPTHWCTRADINYYNSYTNRNRDPLYIFRNYKTGKAYQMSINNDYGKWKISFLDQNDVEGDEITKGDFSKIPDKLLSFVRVGNKTLKDYKNSEPQEIHIGEKGYTNKKESLGEPERISKKTEEKFLKYLKIEKETGDFLVDTDEKVYKKYGPVIKQVVHQASQNQDNEKDKSNIEKYFNTGVKLKENPDWKKKIGKVYYWFEKKPEVKVLFINGKSKIFSQYQDDGVEKNVLATIGAFDNGNYPIKKQGKNGSYANILSKKEIADQNDEQRTTEKFKKIDEYAEEKIAKIYPEAKVSVKSYALLSSSSWLDFVIKLKGESLVFNHFRNKEWKQKLYYDSYKVDNQTTEKLNEIFYDINRYARKLFNGEIIQARSKGLYNGVYEDFKALTKLILSGENK